MTVSTADKKNAGTANSLYLKLIGEEEASKVFTFKNSSRRPKLQRGQTDTFQVATPPLGVLQSISVAHCPRKWRNKARGDTAESATLGSTPWYLFQVVLKSLLDGKRAFFLCRQWVEPSPSPQQLNFTEIPIAEEI